MPGKYSSLRGSIPAFQEEASYQEKINTEKMNLIGVENGKDASVQRLASLFAVTKAAKKKLEDKISEYNIQLEALSQLLVDALEDQDIQKVELASGAICFLQDTPYPVVKDREAILAWIEQQKMQSLLSVHYQTLKAMTNERLIAGEPCIPGTEVYIKTQARIRVSRNGDEE